MMTGKRSHDRYLGRVGRVKKRKYTDEYWKARDRRVQRLRHLLDTDTYPMPTALEVADVMIWGGTSWGERCIDEFGRRIDLGY